MLEIKLEKVQKIKQTRPIIEKRKEYEAKGKYQYGIGGHSNIQYLNSKKMNWAVRQVNERREYKPEDNNKYKEINKNITDLMKEAKKN